MKTRDLNSENPPRESVRPKTKVFWERGEAGKVYDKEFGDFIGEYVNRSEMKPIADLLRDVRNMRVLDVGCGTGRHLALLDPTNAREGLDLSPSMLAEAKTKVPDGIFTVGSVDALPYEDNSFDYVISSRVLQHICDQQKMISEMGRVTKPGGKVILLSYNSWSLLCLYKQTRMSWAGKIINLPFKLILGRRSFFNPWGFEYDNYCSIPELSRYMKKAGLRVRKSWGVTSGMPWFWNDFFVGKVIQRILPLAMKMIFGVSFFLDNTLARIFPLKYFTDKVIVIAEKPR